MKTARTRIGWNVFGFMLFAVLASASNDTEVSSELTVKNVLIKMSPGINLGNTLEAIPKETSWGNPPTTDAFMRGVRKSGFRSIRIPIAWSQYADADFKISPTWMAHIKEVVKKATDADLYALINIHWDGGWIQPTYAKQEAVKKKLQAFWTQIAVGFRDSNDHVLFAGTNEIGVEGVYGPPTEENAKVQNGFNQTFVSAVRSTGGRNKQRFLVVQGYNTDIDAAVKNNAILPLIRPEGS